MVQVQLTKHRQMRYVKITRRSRTRLLPTLFCIFLTVLPCARSILISKVCCDPNFKPYAEASGTFALPGVDLFEHVNADGTTTFYDSVCGIPVFTAPIGTAHCPPTPPHPTPPPH